LSRLLRGEETLAEMGVGARGGLNLWVCEAGGVSGSDLASVFATDAKEPTSGFVAQPDKAGGSDEELVFAVEGLLGQLSREEYAIEGAVQRLRAVHQVSTGEFFQERLVRLHQCTVEHICILNTASLALFVPLFQSLSQESWLDRSF
jgi:hypothetical protein